jgi:hypothetical protein
MYTNFSLRATGWGDVEGDLPLYYSFRAENLQLATRIRITQIKVKSTM